MEIPLDVDVENLYMVEVPEFEGEFVNSIEEVCGENYTDDMRLEAVAEKMKQGHKTEEGIETERGFKEAKKSR